MTTYVPARRPHRQVPDSLPPDPEPRRALLVRLEERITQHFIAAGEALIRIRDERLYLEAGYDCFASYIGTRWNWTREHCYTVMQATEVAHRVRSILQLNAEGDDHDALPNLTQCGELSRLSDEQLAEVVKTTDFTKTSRRELQAAVDAILRRVEDQTKPEPEPEPEPELIFEDLAEDWVKPVINTQIDADGRLLVTAEPVDTQVDPPDAPDATADAHPKSKRKQIIKNAHNRRAWAALSSIEGACRGLSGLNVGGCSRHERKEMLGICRGVIKALNQFAIRLEKGK